MQQTVHGEDHGGGGEDDDDVDDRHRPKVYENERIRKGETELVQLLLAVLRGGLGVCIHYIQIIIVIQQSGHTFLCSSDSNHTHTR